MRKLGLIGLIVILTAVAVNGQDFTRVYLKEINDSSTVLKFGRYRIGLWDGVDTCWVSAANLVDTAELHDSLSDLRSEITASSFWVFRDSTTIVHVNDSTGDTIVFIRDTSGFQGIKLAELLVTTGITVPDNSISDEEIDEGATFNWTNYHTWTACIFSDDGDGDSPDFDWVDESDDYLRIKKYDAGFSMFYNTEGSHRFIFSDDVDDWIYLDTFAADVPMIATDGGCDLVITASSGEISLDDDNLTTTGTLDAGATTVTGNIVVSGTVDGVDVAAFNTDVAGDSANWNTAYGWGDHSGIPATIDDTVDNWFQNKLASNNTETRITVTYQSADSTIDFVVTDMNDDEPEAGDYGNLTGGHGITHDPTGTIKVDTADAVADAEAKPVTGNAVFDFCETTKNYALNSELHTRSHTMTSTSDHTAGNYKLFHSNGSGEVVELVHGASNKVLTSGGASSAPTWETPGAAWDWQDSAGEPPFWVDSAKYAATAGGIDPFIPGKLTVTGPIDRYNIKLELDTTNIYCAHADTFLKLPIDTNEIGHVYDTFQMMHPSILYIPEGKWGYKYWLAGTPPASLGENVHILVSNDEVTWTEFMTATDTLHNPVLEESYFTNGTLLYDPDIVWDENGDLFVVVCLKRTINGTLINYIYCISTDDGIDWTDTTMMIDGYYNVGSDIVADTLSLKFLSPGIIMRGAGDYFMYTGEDTTDAQTGEKLRCGWVAPRIDTLWDNDPDFDETYLFGTTPLVEDTIRVSVTDYTMPAGNKIYHTDEIVYGTDFIISLFNVDSGATNPRIYMAVSVDGEHFTTVSTPLLAATNNSSAWDHNLLYRASGYFIDRGDEVILRMYYCAKSDALDWFTGLTDIHFGDVLHKKEALIWTPDGIGDTIPIFYADSALYPYGVEIQSLEVQTSEDGTYALKFFSYTGGDPPMFHDYIDTLNVGASDQRASSETFEDDDSSLLDRGQIMYMLIPADDIDWIRASFKFYVRDWQ